MTLLLFLQAPRQDNSEIADVVTKAAIGVGVTQLIIGLFLLVGWYYVQRRFVDHEFPGIIQRMTTQIQSLEASFRTDIASVRLDLSAMRADVGILGRQIERHDERLGHQGRRIDRLETRVDNNTARWEGEERRRERDLDDARTGR